VCSEVLALKQRLGNVTIDAKGQWIHQHELPSREVQEAGYMHVTSCVNVIGKEGFKPKTLLFWHCKRLSSGSECRFAGQLLMTSPAFHCIHLSQNPEMGDAGLECLMPGLRRQLTQDRLAGPRRALLHWSTAEQARIGDRLTVLKLDKCGLGDQSACALAHLLESVTTAVVGTTRLDLAELSLTSNPMIGEPGKLALEAARRRWPGLVVRL
jgi:hypothetical protein